MDTDSRTVRVLILIVQRNVLSGKAAYVFAVVFGEPDTERKIYVRFGEGLR